MGIPISVKNGITSWVSIWSEKRNRLYLEVESGGAMKKTTRVKTKRLLYEGKKASGALELYALAISP